MRKNQLRAFGVWAVVSLGFASLCLPAAAQVNSSTQRKKPRMMTPVQRSTAAPPGIELVSKGRHWQLHRLSGVFEGKTYSRFEVYHIAGTRGLEESPLPKVVKDSLLADARSSDPRDTLYMVSRANAEKWASGELQREYERQQKPGDTPDKRLPIKQVLPGAPRLMATSASDCFGWHTVSKQASVSFATTGQLFSLTMENEPGENGFVTGKFKVAFPVQGSAALGLDFRVHQEFCAPIALKFKRVSGSGTLTLGTNIDIDAQVNLTHDFEWELGKIKLAEPHFDAAGIPVYVELDAFADAVIHLEADNLVTVKYAVSGSRTGSLQVNCTMGGCSNSSSFSQTPLSITRELDFAAQGLRGVIKPYLFGGLMVTVGLSGDILSEVPPLAVAKLGPAPYVKADLWAYYGPCSKKGPDLSAVTGDLDFGLDIRAKAWSPALADLDPSGIFPEDWVGADWILYNWEKHLGFLVLGESSALSPLIAGNTSPVADYPSTYTLQMRPCYPYNDPIAYQVDWGDGSSPSVSDTAPPHSGNSISHTYHGKATYSLLGTPLKDQHGRKFPARNTTVSLNTHYQVPGDALPSASPSSSSGPGIGTPADRSTPKSSPAKSTAGPCCPIQAIDPHTGFVAAQDKASGRTFQFNVNDAALLKSLKVGQGVYANFQTHQVSVDGVQPCCNITSMGKAGGVGNIATGQDLGSAVKPGLPCCEVTSVDAARGVVTAKVSSSGQSFQFAVKDASMLKSLRVGQGVYSNFKTHQVSVDGAIPCCDILSAGAEKPIGKAGGSNARGPNAGANAAPPANSTPMPGSRIAQGAKSAPPGSSQGRGVQALFTRTIDPCSVLDLPTLKDGAAPALGKAFPFTVQEGGDELTLYDPSLHNATCVPAPFHIWIEAKAHFKKTRGFPQFESTGHILFDSLVVGQIVSTAPANDPVTAANFQSAALCFTDVHVDDFNLRKIPNWYDDVYMRRVLNDHLTGKERCPDVSALVSLYLQGGKTIPSAAQATSPGGAPVD